jgi:NitT/TauT family transport system ATP-binding protein
VVSAALRPLPELVGAPALAPPASVRTEIGLRNVSVAYPCGRGESRRGETKTVLSALNLDIPTGEFVCVLGETGCGKSTLLRLILGEELPTSGSVEVDGKPVRRVDSRCGYVPQKYSLFPDRTVLGNVMYGPENARAGLFSRITPSYYQFRRSLKAEAQAYLVRMGLRAQDMSKFPHQLSGGMQQRVAIAQALLMHPPVLLMDEAFSALDPSTRSSLQQQLHSVWLESRPTILFVTHNTSEALMMGTRLILLGRHAEGQTKSNLLLDTGNPAAHIPFARRAQSPEFQRLHDEVRQLAFESSSMFRVEQPSELCPPGPLAGEGSLQ